MTWCAVLVFCALCVSSVIVLAQRFINLGNGRQLSEGDVCIGHRSGMYKCQRASQCSSAFRRYKRPPICSYDGDEAIVCCRDVNFSSHPRTQPVDSRVGKSEQACQENQKLSCNTFQFRGKQAIIGGIATAPKEYPHMALIGYGEESSITWSCGGSLISDRYILSAAHCTNPGGGLGPAMWVRLGDLNIATDNDDARPQQFAITSRTNHPDYKPPVLYNDIALYKLNQSVVFNRYVSPVCLHSLHAQPNMKVTAIGWGRTEAGGPKSDSLMKVDISIVSGKECKQLIIKDTILPKGIDEESMICAGEAKGGRDTCQGDSGGPLMLSQPTQGCVNHQIGITSFGRICGMERSPGVYTRISKFIPWIESIVWK